MIKLLTVIGARPQIIKSAAISRYAPDFGVEEVLVHTGQHYDQKMSEVFFDQLQLRTPHYNLGVGSGTHSTQTAKMMIELEAVVHQEQPDYLLVYGDTNSTLAAALVGSKDGIPVVHVEAGLRSFNKTMPEELNRIATDHCSTFLFAPTESGYANLRREGFADFSEGPYTLDRPLVLNSGDVMLDNFLHFSQWPGAGLSVLEGLRLVPNDYVLCTIHRAENTDKPDRLAAILNRLLQAAAEHSRNVVLPLHPRTVKMMQQLPMEVQLKVQNSPHLTLLEPANYLEMLALERFAKFIVTDSGGVQKEAYFSGKACIVLRGETEWVEIVDAGMAFLAGVQSEALLSHWRRLETTPMPGQTHHLFGDGRAAQTILGILKG